MKNFWISWYCPIDEPFMLNFPWWISGWCYDKNDDEIDIICAAIKAEDEKAAKEIINSCYDKYQHNLNFRFVSERDDDWIPYGDRFQKADWMNF
jgi:hypothetical protein